jgi:hypothetical protein
MAEDLNKGNQEVQVSESPAKAILISKKEADRIIEEAMSEAKKERIRKSDEEFVKKLKMEEAEQEFRIEEDSKIAQALHEKEMAGLGNQEVQFSESPARSGSSQMSEFPRIRVGSQEYQDQKVAEARKNHAEQQRAREEKETQEDTESQKRHAQFYKEK